MDIISKEYSEKLISMLKDADHIYIIGDGGSCSLAEHFACDLLKGCHLPAVSLTNPAIITATGNDISFEDTFKIQAEVLCRKHDLLLILSTSGESPNLVYAAQSMYKTGRCKVVSIVGGHTATKLEMYSHLTIKLPSQQTQDVEDQMSILCHQIFKVLSSNK